MKWIPNVENYQITCGDKGKLIAQLNILRNPVQWNGCSVLKTDKVSDIEDSETKALSHICSRAIEGDRNS